MHRLFNAVKVAAMSAVMAMPAAAAQTEQPESSLAPIVRTERVGTGVIRVVYDLAGPPTATFSVALEASNDGAQTFVIRPRATTGDVGASVSPGSAKVILWDSTKDVDDLQVDRYVFRVVVKPGDVASSGSAGQSATAPASAGQGSSPAAAPGRGVAVAKKGGGLSKGALIAIAGGGAAAGVGVAAAKGGGGASTATPPASTTPATTHRNFTANVSFPISFRFSTCVRDEMWTANIVLSLDLASNGTITGNATVNASTLVTSITTSCPASQLGATGTIGLPLSSITGTTSRLVFSGNRTVATGGSTGNKIDDWTFAGSLASDVVTGTMTWNVTFTGDGQTSQGIGSATFSVSAR